MKKFAEWLEERDPEMLEEIFSPETWNKVGRYARGAAALGLTALSFLGGPGQAQGQSPGGGVRGLPSGRVMQDEESPSGQNAPSSAGIVAGDLASKMDEIEKNAEKLADDLKKVFDRAETDKEKAVIAERISEKDKNTGIQKSKKIGNIRYYAFANPQVGAAAQRGKLLQRIATSKATSSAMKEEGVNVRVAGIGSAVSGNIVITTVAVEISVKKSQ
jgi:hypothetical protein